MREPQAVLSPRRESAEPVRESGQKGNLLENAKQHGGGTDVGARTETRDGRVWIVVEDRGNGVPDADGERIFEPFYRNSRHDETEHDGVGLGLPLVKQIARHHGGDAWYEPRDGAGSRFVVTLAKE